MKKILLASCIAAVSVGVNAELTPLSEYELHTVTGQAGVDIELDVGVTIGEIRYTDTEEFDGGGVSDGDGGSLSITNLSIGGIDDRNTLLGFTTPDNGPNLDELIFAIDVKADGSLVIDGKPAGGISPVDIKITVDEVFTSDINGDRQITMVDSLSLYGGALGLKMTVDGATNDITFRTQIGFDDIDVDLTSFLSMNIKDAYIAGQNHNGDPSFFTDSIADIHVVMSKETDGVKFDFSQAPNNNQNIFDMGIGELTIGGDVLGSIAINDLNIRGLSVNVSGH